jgi:hypothetical protein
LKIWETALSFRKQILERFNSNDALKNTADKKKENLQTMEKVSSRLQSALGTLAHVPDVTSLIVVAIILFVYVRLW